MKQTKYFLDDRPVKQLEQRLRIPGKLISQSGANWSVIPVQNDQRSERSDAGRPL
jgi:hypothetical protein